MTYISVNLPWIHEILFSMDNGDSKEPLTDLISLRHLYCQTYAWFNVIIGLKLPFLDINVDFREPYLGK